RAVPLLTFLLIDEHARGEYNRPHSRGRKEPFLYIPLHPSDHRVEEVAMAEMIRTAQYFKMQVPEKPGAGAKRLAVLRDAGVNLLAYSGFPRNRRAPLDLVPGGAMAVRPGGKLAKWKVQGAEGGFLVGGGGRRWAAAGLVARVVQGM